MSETWNSKKKVYTLKLFLHRNSFIKSNNTIIRKWTKRHKGREQNAQKRITKYTRGIEKQNQNTE
jgi:hypothetical protein